MIFSKAIKTVLLSVSLLCYAGVFYSQQIAFPGAEGYGKYTTGGRGGTVYEVTTLNPSGAGSLGAAISASGARTVVFKVSGTITGNFNISNGNITIAGQTAPGDGICIKGNLSTSADNIIIRYIRVRHDPSIIGDAIGGRYHQNIIIDHVSASWSADEVFTLYFNKNTTVQWCIISEGCEKAGEGHRFGGIWGNNPGTWHHNLFAHNDSRNPRWASGCGYNDYRNNVLYNWGYGSCYGGEKQQPGDSRFTFFTVNMIANYYKYGPATNASIKRRIAEPSARSTDDKGDWYVSDNYVEGYPAVTADNWKGIDGSNYIKLSAPWSAMPINQQSPQDAYDAVLDGAGCSFPNRDTVDARIIEEVLTGTAIYGNNGIIDVPSDVGGWPVLAAGTPYTDSDHDGMSDDWETASGLNPGDPADRNVIGEGGFTNLEVFLYNLLGDGGSVTSVSVSPTIADLYVGTAKYLSAIIVPANPVNKNVSWSSSDTSVATVDTTGLVTGVAVGSATITVTTQDGSFTATSIATVSNIPVTGVKVSPTTASVNVGSTKQLTATISPYNAFDQNVSWSSSDTSVATVDTTGLVTGVAVGSAVITVTTEDGGFTATSNIAVSEPTSIATIESVQDISIYPIPFNNRLNIKFGKEPAETVDILLLDVTGRIVRYKKAVGLNHQFDTTDLNEGLYLIKIIGTTINVVGTVIKIR